MPELRKDIPLQQRWKVALANAGTNQTAWANTNGWSDVHVGLVVTGARVSDGVLEKVTAFIEEQERLIAERAPAA